MHSECVPTCYFPSTVLFLHNNHDFLLNLILQLDDMLAYQLFDNTNTALEHIYRQYYKSKQNLARGSIQAQHGMLANSAINLDLASIYAEIYNHERFTEISVIVVDNTLPNMSGLEFCAKIPKPNIKKILVINHTDEDMAISAVKAGLIERYIKKSDIYAIDQLITSIHELQLQYFQDLSSSLVKLLPTFAPICLYDQRFINFFQELCAEKGVVEYYLLENTGSFFMLDDEANASILLIKTTENLRLYYQHAIEQYVSPLVLEELATGKKIPVSWPITTLDEWQDSLVSAECLQLDEPYYYAYLPATTYFDTSLESIFAYNRYVKKGLSEILL